MFSKLGPWRKTELIREVCGAVVSVRPLQNGRHLIGCRDAAQQGTLSRCQRLTGGVAIKCLVPVPTVEGVMA